MKKFNILTMEKYFVGYINDLLNDALLFSNLYKDWQLT